MFERFTDRTRKAMGYARKEAERLRHDYIGTEHMLLGMLREGSGVAANVIERLGAQAGALSAAVEGLAGTGACGSAPDHMPFTPHAKAALEHSWEEAQRLDDDYVGTEHLLLGLLREPDCMAFMALSDNGVAFEAARAAVIEILEDASPAPHARPTLKPLAVNGMVDTMTDEARKAMQGALEEASWHFDRDMTTAHLFLGMMKEPESVASRVMLALGVLPENVAARMKRYMESRSAENAPEISLTSRAMKVLESAFEDVYDLPREHPVGTGHLLMAILREGKSPAASVLADLGVEFETARREWLKLLDDKAEKDG